MIVDDRFSRNVALFGHAGQKRISASLVGVVGLGGLGSHVAQQLVYLGVRDLTYVDDDQITTSSLNRVVTAVEDDALSTAKVDAAARLTHAVAVGAQVVALRAKLEDARAQEALARCTSVFGCLDSDPARIELIELCARHGIPFFDLATDTGAEEGVAWYGGRVLFSGEGERCPSCMDLLDQRAMSLAAMDGPQRETDDRIYGVQRAALEGTGPAVVGLNGVVASLAVMEWMVWTTKLREPRTLLEYRGTNGAVFASSDEPAAGCYYCGLWRRPTDAPI